MEGLKDEQEIASELGYAKPNIISMFMAGEARVPLDKIRALAKAIDVDPALLFRLGIEQYWQDPSAIDAIFGTVLTRNEAEIIGVFRHVVGNADPEITPQTRRILTACFRGLV